jgi:hypothetical protein
MSLPTFHDCTARGWFHGGYPYFAGVSRADRQSKLPVMTAAIRIPEGKMAPRHGSFQQRTPCRGRSKGTQSLHSWGKL